ncbi:MAG: hypothetical protein ACD_20C00075G0004 [uncultured bacterium]|nr:MAG: hypothetical protein ACD_20C00075G0004 [uncultured bacterium]HBH18250.1 hypothetical protein [Cyanobacteria bacterium UBA9579]
MNKKASFPLQKAFTLAELLLSLTIIGVIASYTIPTLMQNVQEAYFKTAWKKAFSDFNQATSRLLLDNGGTLAGVFANSNDIKNKYAQHLIHIKSCNVNAFGSCWHPDMGFYYMNGTAVDWNNPSGLIGGNGNLVYIIWRSLDCELEIYGVKKCGSIWIDINGFKEPNTVGKDIFGMDILKDRLRPYGAIGDVFPPATDCTSTGEGRGCSALYLMQ